MTRIGKLDFPDWCLEFFSEVQSFKHLVFIAYLKGTCGHNCQSLHNGPHSTFQVTFREVDHHAAHSSRTVTKASKVAYNTLFSVLVKPILRPSIKTSWTFPLGRKTHVKLFRNNVKQGPYSSFFATFSVHKFTNTSKKETPHLLQLQRILLY